MAHPLQDSDTFTPAPDGKHKTVLVQYESLAAEIDELIAPLILELWKAEIPTYQSCQDNPGGSGFFWLQFDKQWALERFLNTVALFTMGCEDLQFRMKFGYGSRDVVEPDHWCYEVVVQDFCDPMEFGPEPGEEENLPCFGLLFCVHIPMGDLSTVFDAILDHNQAVAKNQATETAIKMD